MSRTKNLKTSGRNLANRFRLATNGHREQIQRNDDTTDDGDDYEAGHAITKLTTARRALTEGKVDQRTIVAD